MNEEARAAAVRLFAGPCEFVWGSPAAAQLPPAKLPETAFIGRSNAGKSSLINALTGRTALARVSRTPGRTRQINFFRLGGSLMLADLPGYGYAKASKALAQEWQALIFAYLKERASLRRVMLLIDARRGPMDTDRAVMELLDGLAVSFALVLTKLDELDAPGRANAFENAQKAARGHNAAFPEIYATSARTREGLDALKMHLAALADL